MYRQNQGTIWMTILTKVIWHELIFPKSEDMHACTAQFGDNIVYMKHADAVITLGSLVSPRSV